MLFILEASKEDAKRAIKSGERIHTLRKGARIQLSDTMKPQTYRGGIKYYPFKYDKKKEDPDKKYKKEYSINKDKIGSNKEKTDRQKIRDAARSIEGNVPEHGADPTKSKDADPKAVKKFYKSKKYSDIDIDQTVENMPAGKAAMVRRAIESGGPLPDSIKKQLVKKKDSRIIKDNRGHSDASSFFDHKFEDKDDKDKKRLKKLHYILQTTKDYGEYKKAYAEIERLTGSSKTDTMTAIDSNNNGFQFYRKRSPGKEKLSSNDTLYHGSKNDKIKQLTPTFRSSDGAAYYREPRIYASKNSHGNKNVGTDTSNSTTHQYKIDKRVKKVKVDPELGGSARYFTTHKEIPVEKVDKKK